MKSLWLIFTLLMPLTAAFAAEQSPIDPSQRIIQMDGRGEVRAAPDQASISFAIETKGSTAQEAGTQNAQIAQRVIAVLKSKIGAGGKVETAGYSLTPLYAAGGPVGQDSRLDRCQHSGGRMRSINCGQRA